MLLAYYDLCWFVSSHDDNLKLEENEPRDYLVSLTNKMKIKKRERERSTRKPWAPQAMASTAACGPSAPVPLDGAH